MKTALFILILLHGLIHVLGFVKGFDLAPLEQFKLPIGKPAGLLWLIATVLMVATALLYLLNVSWWWAVALPSLLLSQVLIIVFWADAKAGTIPNVILALPLTLALLNSLPGSFQSMYRADTDATMAALPSSSDSISEEDLAPLPPLVQQYIRRSGAVGKPHIQAFAARFTGRFRNGFDAAWMDFTSEQLNTISPSTRYFLMKAGMYGIPMDGLHRFVGDSARMQIRIASALEVVNASGPEMNKAETVTIFNDICVMAPAALLDLDIVWTPIDAQSVQARYTRNGITISATLTFTPQGDLANFISNDRYFNSDGKTNIPLPWSTPVSSYKDYGSAHLPSRGDATWHRPEGEFVYGEFLLQEIDYFPPWP